MKETKKTAFMIPMHLAGFIKTISMKLFKILT